MTISDNFSNVVSSKNGVQINAREPKPRKNRRPGRELSAQLIWSKSEHFEPVSRPGLRPENVFCLKNGCVGRTYFREFFADLLKFKNEELRRWHTQIPMRLLARVRLASPRGRLELWLSSFFAKHRFYTNVFGKLCREFSVANVNQP